MNIRDKASRPPNKDEFARLVMDAIRKAGEKEPLRYDPEQYRLHREGDVQNLAYLGNVYDEYCASSPDKRAVVLKNFVRTWFVYRREPPEEFEDVKPDLLPGVRSRASFELTSLRMKMDEEGKFNWPFHVLGDSLGVGLVYDLPESMMQVQQSSLDGWGTTFAEAFEVACRNLQEISQRGLEQVAPGVWVSPWKDNYDPSRMLLVDIIRRHEVTGDPVVMVPNRDTLLLAGSRDADGLTRLAEMAEEAYEMPRPITGLAYRLTGEGEWVPFLPGQDHPQFEKFQLLRVKSVGGDYADQAAILNALHEKTGKDIFVAGFSAWRKDETGEVRSYCVWSEGVVTLLPRTDDVFFFRPRGKEEGDIVATAPWEKAAEVLGDLMKPVGLHPERYLVTGFPSGEQLAALGPG